MKTGLLLLLLLLFASRGNAQIPNGDFETWQGDTVLVGWYSNTNFLAHTIVRSTDSYNGTYALEGMVGSYLGVPFPALVQAGIDAQGFPFTTRPGVLSGWYKFSTPDGSGDYLYITTALYKGGLSGAGVAAGSVQITASAPTYTQFSIPLTYLSSDFPDTAVIQVGIGHSGSASSFSPSTQFFLDFLSYSGTNGIAAERTSLPQTYLLSQNYPNPFNPSTTITFALPKAGYTKLVVYDLLGRRVATLVDGFVNAGTHTIRFEDSRLPSGVYLYQLESGSYRATRRMTLMK